MLTLQVLVTLPTISYSRGGQLFSSAGHIEPSFVSRGPHLGHKGLKILKASKIGPRGPDVARGPYVAPSCLIATVSQKLAKFIDKCGYHLLVFEKTELF
jgi:hypothetical protein